MHCYQSIECVQIKINLKSRLLISRKLSKTTHKKIKNQGFIFSTLYVPYRTRTDAGRTGALILRTRTLSSVFLRTLQVKNACRRIKHVIDRKIVKISIT